MAIGDDAAAAGFDLVPGSLPSNQIDTEFNKTRDLIATFIRAEVQAAVTAVTGASSSIVNNALVKRSSTGHVAMPEPNSPNHAARYAEVQNLYAITDNIIDNYLDTLVQVAGDTMTGLLTLSAGLTVNNGATFNGDIYNPGRSAATSGPVIAYFNSDGRIGRGNSAAKYKKFITERDPAELGDLFAAAFSRWQMKQVNGQGDGAWRYGYIADTLVGTDMEPFVIIIDDEVESIDFIGLLLAQVAQLNARDVDRQADLAALTARVEALEAD